MAGTTEEVKIRELPEKTTINFNDKFIVEDNDGTKQVAAIALRSLMQKCVFYDNIEAMKSANLQEGDAVQTLGYYEPHDGGGALYQIMYAPTDLEDNMTVHYLHTSDTLRAHLVNPVKMNVLWAGAKGDGVTDDYSAIRKALDSGLPVYFPNRTYKIRTALEINSNMHIDFNGCTLLCENSACLSLVNLHNMDINNVVLRGKQGISIAGSCDRISIFDTTIASPAPDIKQQYGIIINGAKNINISDCEIGDDPYTAPTLNGISIGVGTVNNSTVLSERISIEDCDIQAEYHGIEDTSAANTKGLNITNCQFSGPESVGRDDADSTGIWIGSNNKNISISKCGFTKLTCGLQITSLVSSYVHASDITSYDTKYAYSVLSDKASLSLDGIQTFYADSTNANNYIFNKMNGTLCVTTHDIVTENTTVKNRANAITGRINDITEGQAIYSSSSNTVNLTDNLFNARVYVIDNTYVSTINNGVNGQKIKISAQPGLTSVSSYVKATDTIKLGGGKATAPLPITLQYSGSCWVEI